MPVCSTICIRVIFVCHWAKRKPCLGTAPGHHALSDKQFTPLPPVTRHCGSTPLAINIFHSRSTLISASSSFETNNLYFRFVSLRRDSSISTILDCKHMRKLSWEWHVKSRQLCRVISGSDRSMLQLRWNGRTWTGDFDWVRLWSGSW